MLIRYKSKFKIKQVLSWSEIMFTAMYQVYYLLTDDKRFKDFMCGIFSTCVKTKYT